MGTILEKKPVLVLRKMIIFPKNTYIVDLARDFSINAIKHETNDNLVIALTQKNQDIDNPQQKEDFFEIGTLCDVSKIEKIGSAYQVEIIGIKRVKIKKITFDKNNKIFFCDSAFLEEEGGDEKEKKILMQKIISDIKKINIFFGLDTKYDLISEVLARSNDASDLANFLSNNLPMEQKKRINLFQLNKINDKLFEIYKIICEIKETNEIYKEIKERVSRDIDKNQIDFYLRKEKESIEKRLGDINGNENNDIIKRLENNPYPKDIKERVKKEINRLKTMPSMSIEYSILKQYIDLLMALPWWQETVDNYDLKNAENILNKTHYGIEDTKRRILEFLAVKKISNNLRSPIICLYGNPGVGKSSIAKSIAKALNRKFGSISLAGMSDEGEIRGHRKTYVASKPGKIIDIIKKCGVKNPVILLDEIDKLGQNNSPTKGDVFNALLEILDPEQNKNFTDNHVEEPFDISNVLFIATANRIDVLSSPLLDRMEVIKINSYIDEEKFKIAKDFLFPKKIKEYNLNEKDISISDSSIKEIIVHYTMESGVRNLERQIDKIIRKIILEYEKENKKISNIKIGHPEVKKYLGEYKFFLDNQKEKDKIGLINGLCYTEYGGDLLKIEVNYFCGTGKISLTGNLGDIIKESAMIALDYVKANCNKYFKNLSPDFFSKNDFHIHFPDGAIPKDGPSAGIAIALAIISCISGKTIKNDFALTGEINLHGEALAIGGLREKTAAAVRGKIKNVIIPEKNKGDIEKLPLAIKKNLNIIFMKTIDDAIIVLNN